MFWHESLKWEIFDMEGVNKKILKEDCSEGYEWDSLRKG